jgi:hypothetical protein
MVQQLNRQQQVVTPDVSGILYDLEIVAQVLSWDNFTYGTANQYKPEDIKAISNVTEGIIWYRVGVGAVPISVDQFAYFWEQIQTKKQPEEKVDVVKLAKETGTAVYENGCKLGFVVQYRKDFYAVSEMLVHGRGFQYSQSRHGSFQLAVDALVEQSWTEEVA